MATETDEAHQIDGLNLEAENVHRLRFEDRWKWLQVRAEDPLHRGLKHGRQPDRDHDHRDDRLADHRAQHDDLERHAEDQHEHQCDRHAEIERQLVFRQQPPANPGADQKELALREVHHLSRLVDQHERHRDDAIERADNEAVGQELDEKLCVHGMRLPLTRPRGQRGWTRPHRGPRRRGVVCTRWVVPSWKRISVSTAISGWPA